MNANHIRSVEVITFPTLHVHMVLQCATCPPHYFRGTKKTTQLSGTVAWEATAGYLIVLVGHVHVSMSDEDTGRLASGMGLQDQCLNRRESELP